MAPRRRDGMPLIDREQMKLAGRVGSVGIELVIAMLIGWYGGRWLDEKLGTEKTFALIGLVLGLAAGFRSLFRLSKKSPSGPSQPLERAETKDKDPEGPA